MKVNTEILLLTNDTSIKWISKRQEIVEITTYGSELLLDKQAIELILEYRYILMIMSARLKKSALLLRANNGVLLNTTMQSSVLKKRHCVVSYYRNREMIVAGILKFNHIPN